MFTPLRKFTLNFVSNSLAVRQQGSKWRFPSVCSVQFKRNLFNNAESVPMTVPPSKAERTKGSAADIVETYLKTHGPALDFSSIKSTLISKCENLNETNFDAVFIRACAKVQQFSLGHGYLALMKKEGKKPNVATLSHYLKLCHKCSKEIENPEEVELICRELLSLQILNPTIIESAILGFCAIGQWENGLNLLPKLEELQSPCVTVMDELMLGAIHHRNSEVLLSLLNQTMNLKREISKCIFPEWIAASSNDEKLFRALIDTLSVNEIFLSTSVANDLKDAFEKVKDNCIGSFTTVNLQTGECNHCREVLKPVKLENSQYFALKNAVMNKVLCGSDIFIGSTPEEVKKFLKFLQHYAPFDVVIDGMNVCYLHGSKLNTKGKLLQLVRVVNHFHRQRKRVLVVVKKHAVKWMDSENILREVKRKASLFYVDDMSRDDLFILYATLHSEGAQFVSDDQMRNHAFHLKNTQFETLFWHWMRSSQVSVASIHPNGTVITRPPPVILGTTQCANGNWHIPYDDGSFRGPREVPRTWICLKRSK